MAVSAQEVHSQCVCEEKKHVGLLLLSRIIFAKKSLSRKDGSTSAESERPLDPRLTAGVLERARANFALAAAELTFRPLL